MFGKTVSYQFQTVKPAFQHQDQGVVAGRAIRDITPPVGMPKAGYSSNAHTGQGFRTRLKVRVVYLRAAGKPLAFVQLDALGGSLIVRLEVLKRIAAYTDVAPENLVLAATHTHAGAGQYASCNFYNRFASNKSGFEPRYFDFLCTQISDAIIEAYQHTRAAKVAHGCQEVWGLTRNRSLIPHHKNQQRLIKEPLNHAKFYAINPRLSLLRIDAQHEDGQFYPLAAISTFAIHGTGVSQHEDEYNGDVWAYIERELEVGVTQNPWPLVHAAVEGTHGDVAPAIRYGAAGYLEARRVGKAIGQQALVLFQSLSSQLSDTVNIASAIRTLDLQDTRYKLPKPAVGAALMAGAQENLTPIIHRLPPFKAGLGIDKAANTQQPHGNKNRLLPDFIRDLVLPENEFPHLLPMQIFQVGDFVFVGLPFEITVQAGRHIEARIWESSVSSKQQALVTISSVCNDYFGYCTTHEEYGCQYYEGGHTLYGERSNEFLAIQVASLWRDLQSNGNFQDQPYDWQFKFQRGDYMPPSQGALGLRVISQQAIFEDAQGLHEGSWKLQWQDVNASLIQWHLPLVNVEYSDDGKVWHILTSDEGYDVSVRHIRRLAQGMALYECRWFNPEFLGKRCYRFVIEARMEGDKLYSEIFGGNILVDGM